MAKTERLKSDFEQLGQLTVPRQGSGQARPQDNPHCSALPCSHCSPPIISFLPGFREPCREGRSVMGAWSMPSLPSAKPLASSPRRQLEIPQNNLNQQVKVGPRELSADQLQVRGSHVAHLSPCISQTQPEARQKGPLTATSHPYQGGSQTLAPPCPQGQRKRKHSAAAPHHP